MNKETILLDISKGVSAATDGLQKTIEVLDCDLIIGLDVGGDVLAEGSEKGLASPLADTMCLASLSRLKGVKKVLAVFGSCADGELRLLEVLNRMSLVAKMGGALGVRGITPKDISILEKGMEYVTTEASRMALDSGKGVHGIYHIRQSRREVDLTYLASLTFYFDPNVVFSVSRIAQAVTAADYFEQANQTLLNMGIKSEYEYEIEYLQRNPRPKDWKPPV